MPVTAWFVGAVTVTGAPASSGAPDSTIWNCRTEYWFCSARLRPEEFQLDRGAGAQARGRLFDRRRIDLIKDQSFDHQAGGVDDLEQLVAWSDDLPGNHARRRNHSVHRCAQVFGAQSGAQKVAPPLLQPFELNANVLNGRFRNDILRE